MKPSFFQWRKIEGPWRFFVYGVLVGCLLILPAYGLAETEPSLLLAKVYGWESGQNPALYWVSEKYDGVRAYWDGERLRFRSGRLVAAPAWFVAGLPRVPLDGELWSGRGKFQRLVSIVRKQTPIATEWQEVRFMVFELPGAAGSYTERIVRIIHLVESSHRPWLQAVPQFRVSDRQELKERLAEVVSAGGEGLMLHRAGAPYHGGRSSDLLKVKLWQDDEAKVVAHRPGSGKYHGMMGALEVETEQGLRFLVGTGFTDQERRKPPPIGSTITYRYTGSTRDGLPRFPAFVRIREEL